jgi:hypothetical protein
MLLKKLNNIPPQIQIRKTANIGIIYFVEQVGF